MSEKTNDQESVFKTDDMYLPIHYKGILVEEPSYLGNGVYNIIQLEKICNEFKEYCHQQNVIKHNAFKHIIELRRELGKS